MVDTSGNDCRAVGGRFFRDGEVGGDVVTKSATQHLGVEFFTGVAEKVFALEVVTILGRGTLLVKSSQDARWHIHHRASHVGSEPVGPEATSDLGCLVDCDLTTKRVVIFRKEWQPNDFPPVGRNGTAFRLMREQPTDKIILMSAVGNNNHRRIRLQAGEEIPQKPIPLLITCEL